MHFLFQHDYKDLGPSYKIFHHIPGVSGAVCKLYFDLEYDRTLNPGRDGDKMVETLIKVTITFHFCTKDSYTVLQIRRGNRDNFGIIIHIFS